jgi:hypothetical protein
MAVFGVSVTGKTARSTKRSVQVADQLDELGNIVGSQSYGGTEEITEKGYAASATAINTAINEQTGSTIITADNIEESNTGFVEQEIVTRNAL